MCFGERKDKEVRSQMGLGETWLGLCTAVVMAVEAGMSSALSGNSTNPGGISQLNSLFLTGIDIIGYPGPAIRLCSSFTPLVPSKPA